jgi:hypothetical protein
MSVYKETGASYLTRTKAYYLYEEKWCRPSEEYTVDYSLPHSLLRT